MSLSQSWRMWCSTCPFLLVNFPHKIWMVFWSAFPCSPSVSGSAQAPSCWGSWWFCACVPHPPDAVGQRDVFSSWRRQGCKKECPAQTGTYPTPTCVMLTKQVPKSNSKSRAKNILSTSSPNNEAMTKEVSAERVEELWRIHLSTTCSYCHKIKLEKLT